MVHCSCRSCRRMQLVIVELLLTFWMRCIYSSIPVYCITTRFSIFKNTKQYHHHQQYQYQQQLRPRRQTKRNYFSTTIVQQNTTTTPYDDDNDHQQQQPSNKAVFHPFLGPLIEADNAPVILPSSKYEIPNNLQYVGLELDTVPVGFQRLRWAMLSRNSLFVTEGWYKNVEHYSNIEMKEWDQYSNQIGEPTNQQSQKGNMNHAFIGAQKECQYIMPKSRFISAMMCYETHTILEYNDYCFCLRKQAKTPNVPFGNQFITWTQYTFINTGHNTCKVICSVEPQFLNNNNNKNNKNNSSNKSIPTIISKQIISGMKAGTKDLFRSLGTTIENYANVVP